jgi:hypothetical protein
MLSWCGRGPTAPLTFHLHGAHPATYTVSIRLYNMGEKRPGCEADHPPQSSAEIKNMWTYTSTLTYILQGMILGYKKGRLYLYLTDLCQVKRICSWLDIHRHMRICKDNISEHRKAKNVVDCIHIHISFPFLFK